MKIKLLEVQLKNDCFYQTRGYFHTNDDTVEELVLDTDKQEVVIKLVGHQKFEMPAANVRHRRYAPVGVKSKKDNDKPKIAGLPEYPEE